MEYVPYNEYPTLLHKGEAVLTASDNKEYQAKKSNLQQNEQDSPNIDVKVDIAIENFNNESDRDIYSLIDYLLQIID